MYVNRKDHQRPKKENVMVLEIAVRNSMHWSGEVDSKRFCNAFSSQGIGKLFLWYLLLSRLMALHHS